MEGILLDLPNAELSFSMVIQGVSSLAKQSDNITHMHKIPKHI